jgi:hypothetical protein
MQPGRIILMPQALTVVSIVKTIARLAAALHSTVSPSDETSCPGFVPTPCLASSLKVKVLRHRLLISIGDLVDRERSIIMRSVLPVAGTWVQPEVVTFIHGGSLTKEVELSYRRIWRCNQNSSYILTLKYSGVLLISRLYEQVWAQLVSH